VTHISLGHANHPIASRLKPGGADRIPGLNLWQPVGVTIDLDHQPRRMVRKIRHIGPDRRLSANIAMQLAQLSPQQALGQGRSPSQPTRHFHGAGRGTRSIAA
jgi:hypothetical protein